MVTERVPINNSLSLSRAHMHVSQIFPIAVLHPAGNHPAKRQKHTACLLGQICANACICICSVSNRAHATAQIQQNGCLSNQSPPPPPPPPISLFPCACSYIFAYASVQIHNCRANLQPTGLTRPLLHQRCRLCLPSAPAGACGVRRLLSQAKMRISADRVRAGSSALLPHHTARLSQSRSCNCRC